MRPIKFRVWNDKEKAWIHDTAHACNILGETIILGEWMVGIKPEDLNDVVVEQFTGLLDKNGKEIYEGDILKCSTLHPDDHETPGLEVFNTQVKFSERAGFITGFYAFPVWSWSKELGNPSCWCEVIGNIHENPELLNQKPL